MYVLGLEWRIEATYLKRESNFLFPSQRKSIKKGKIKEKKDTLSKGNKKKMPKYDIAQNVTYFNEVILSFVLLLMIHQGACYTPW